MLKKALFLTSALVIFLTVSAMAQENVVKVLRTSNLAQTNKYVCKAFEFKNTNPYDVVNFFEEAARREEGGVISLATPDSKSGFIVVMCPEYQLETLTNLAKELDRPKLNSAPGSKYIYYRMKNRNIGDPSLQSVLGLYLGASGAIYPDVETNSVVLFDANKGAVNCEETLKTVLDFPLLQVEMDVNIYEVQVNNDGTLGLDFEDWKNGPGKVLGLFDANGTYLNAKNTGHYHINNRGSGLYLDYPSAYFDALVQKGKAKELINTRISSLNGYESLITSGEQLLYYKVDHDAVQLNREVTGTVDPQNELTLPTGEVVSVDTGVLLDITPTIGTDMINMDINLQVISNLGYEDDGTPILNRREFSNEIAVANGNNVMFGGLSREQEIKITRKIPLLGSLPVIGYIFGGEVTTVSKTVIVASVTPKVVGDMDKNLQVISHLGNNVTEDDQNIAKKAKGEEVVKLPKSEFCFEQNATKNW